MAGRLENQILQWCGVDSTQSNDTTGQPKNIKCTSDNSGALYPSTTSNSISLGAYYTYPQVGEYAPRLSTYSQWGSTDGSSSKSPSRDYVTQFSMSGGPPQHPHGRQAPPNSAWNHLQVPNFYPGRQPQHAHMSNELPMLASHQPTWHTPTTAEPSKGLSHSPLFNLQQMLGSERPYPRHSPGVDLTLTRNGSQNGDLPQIPISLSVRDTKQINSLPMGAALDGDRAVELTKGEKNIRRPTKRMDSIIDRLNTSTNEKQLPQSVIVTASSSHDENSNSSQGTAIASVPTPTLIRDDEIPSPISNEDSLDSNKSRRKRKPSKTMKVAKEETDNPNEADKVSTLVQAAESVSQVLEPPRDSVKTPPPPSRRRSSSEPPSSPSPGSKSRRKTVSESETIDNIAAMVAATTNNCRNTGSEPLNHPGKLTTESVMNLGLTARSAQISRKPMPPLSNSGLGTLPSGLSSLIPDSLVSLTPGSIAVLTSSSVTGLTSATMTGPLSRLPLGSMAGVTSGPMTGSMVGVPTDSLTSLATGSLSSLASGSMENLASGLTTNLALCSKTRLPRESLTSLASESTVNLPSESMTTLTCGSASGTTTNLVPESTSNLTPEAMTGATVEHESISDVAPIATLSGVVLTVPSSNMINTVAVKPKNDASSSSMTLALTDEDTSNIPLAKAVSVITRDHSNCSSDTVIIPTVNINASNPLNSLSTPPSPGQLSLTPDTVDPLEASTSSQLATLAQKKGGDTQCFVAVEDELEKMFAGIADADLNAQPESDPLAIASTSQLHDNVTSTSNEVANGGKNSAHKRGRPKGSKNTSRRPSESNSTDSTPRKKHKASKKRDELDETLLRSALNATKLKKSKKAGKLQLNNKPDVVKDVYSYDSGSNASSSRSKGPFIQIKGPRDSPISVSIVNTPCNEDDPDKPGKQFKNKKFHDDSEYRHKVRSKGLHCSTLSNKYDAQTRDATWICVFCKRGPHATDPQLPGPSPFTLDAPQYSPGDLFGPYVITTDCAEYQRRFDDPFDAQYKSKRAAQALQGADPGKIFHGKKSKKRQNSESSLRDSMEGVDFGKDIMFGIAEVTATNFEVWVHEDCVIWGPGVYLVGPKIMGLEGAVWGACAVACKRCGLKGAAVCCLKRGCGSVMHIGCAKLSNWNLDEEHYKAYCIEHSVKP